ncbi:MAG TPA: DUF885 domain-containing protein [Gemmatimonadales bacterium]|nr:DUF885 domain-containing protein [Gemmatimonadales bacterium]
MPGLLAVPLLWFTCLTAPIAPPSPPTFAAFVDAYFDSLFAFAPSLGTAAGLHQYDARLEDRTATAIGRRIGTLHGQLAQLDALRRGPLAGDDSIDAAMLDGALRAELLDAEVIGNWRRNPITYVSLGGNAVDLLMKRDFAPPLERLQSVTARLASIPAVLLAMRANVAKPPKEFTDLAIQVARGSVGFFRDDVARWAKGAAAGDTAALNAFTETNNYVVQAMQDAADWLARDLSKRSTGSFAIGATAFADKLRYEEMVDIPLDRLLALGEANLAKDRAAFLETAALVAPGKTPAQAMATLEADHPTKATLLEATRATLEGTRQFLIDHQIVDIPSEVRPIVAETPPYARVGTFASMDTPGAFETKATEAFYYVTPVEADWDSAHAEEHLRLYNRAVMSIITIHEAFPGHYLQFLYVKQFPTKTRKLLYANTNVEGWAHYGEQMIVDEGFGGNDPRTRLAQLQEALLRDCRWVAGIKEHTQGLSVADAAKQYFTDQCFQQPANAFEEARRGTYDPIYLYYSFGKLAIYKLRADYQKLKGSAFTLRDFHDKFAQQGGVPIKLMRRILMPGDTAAVLE